MRIASIDLGSNSFLLLIADVEKGQLTNKILDICTITRLAQGVDKTKQIQPEALVRAEVCFKDFQEKIKEHGVEKVIAVSTSAARDAQNSEVFFELGKKYGIPIQIIPGAKEAELTYYGAGAEDDKAVIDVGGGSTEIIYNVNNEIYGKSLDIGSVRLKEKFLFSNPPQEQELEKLLDYIRLQLKSSDLKSFFTKNQTVVAVAGTPTTLACMEIGVEYNEEKINGFIFTLNKLEAWFNRLSALSSSEIQKIPGIDPKRSDVITAGLAILLETLKYLGAKQLVVSTGGVRYGILRKSNEY